MLHERCRNVFERLLEGAARQSHSFFITACTLSHSCQSHFDRASGGLIEPSTPLFHLDRSTQKHTCTNRHLTRHPIYPFDTAYSRFRPIGVQFSPFSILSTRTHTHTHTNIYSQLIQTHTNTPEQQAQVSVTSR